MAAQGTGVLVAAGPPLDFSFKELKNCVEIENEEPRGVAGRPVKKNPHLGSSASSAQAAPAATAEEEGQDTGDQTGSAQAAAGQAGAKGRQGAAASGAAGTGGVVAPGAKAAAAPVRALVIQQHTVAVKLNNNQIESLSDLPQALESVMYDPVGRLQWLDLSFNLLSSVEASLLRYPGLKALYLHGNRIKSLPNVERLRNLPKLISLTMNGNPVENKKIYRAYIIGALPNLRSLDHATIAEDELERAYAWFQAHLLRDKARKEALENERYLASLRE